MARRLRNADGKVVRIELSAEEMAQALDIVPNVDPSAPSPAKVLAGWAPVVAPLRQEADGTPVYGFSSASELSLLKKRAALLRTQMSPQAVANVEKQGLLDAYAALATDCPPGITAHVWRSYGVVVTMQIRYSQKIDAEELAQRAGLTDVDPSTGKRVLGVKTADRHMRLLDALGYLRQGTGRWEGQWLHNGLPEAWRGV
jgi:hypothetical protein